MTMGSEEGSSSSEALHNFTMPTGLKWGNRKFLRCMKVNADGQMSAVERKTTSSYSYGGGVSDGAGFTQMIRSQTVKVDSYRSDKKREMGLSFRPPLPPEKRLKMIEDGGADDEDGIVAVKEKMILGFRNEADKMKDSILMKENFMDDLTESPAAEDGVRPWNLRTRRAALKFESCGNGGTVFNSGGGGGVENNQDILNSKSNAFKTSSPSRIGAGETQMTPRLRSETAVASPSGEKKERPKFSIPLSRREIEEDFITLVGHKPPRRPKRRAKYIQKNLDTLLPGAWLTEITPDLYKVPES